MQEVNSLTSFLQLEVCEKITSDIPEMKEHLNDVNQMPDYKSIEIMQTNIIEMLKLVPFAHTVGINIITSLIGSMAGTIGLNMVVDMITEINEETFNDDRN